MLKWISLILLLIVLVACQPLDAPSVNAPVLVQEVTLAATEVQPAGVLSPTVLTQPFRPTSEVVSPLNQVTADAQFVIVTPTLPPSKTPTPTQTQTQTPTVTPTTTMTNTATATAFILPTSELQEATDIASSNADRICDSNWFFIEPEPPGCPLNEPTASAGVYQEFESGYMIWVGSLQAIYILYTDANQPRWEVSRDFFDENNASMAYLDDDPRQVAPNLWSPRRGFGLIWEQNIDVRNRIGGATQQWEQPYSAQVQTDSNNSIFISTPSTFVIGLIGNGTNWQRYYSFVFTPQEVVPNNTSVPLAPIGGTIIPTRSP
ncbi:MAG: hypothetical protein Phog2KO_04640 [Phototrophicaceae bacterium]